MKTQIKWAAIICMIFCLGINKIFAQLKINSQSTVSSFAYGDMLANRSGDGSLVKSRVSQPALITFSRTYGDASNVKWYRVGKFYGVNFISKEKAYKCLYNVKGHHMYSIMYGAEKDMPRDLRKQVKREYFDYAITSAAEVFEDGRHVWLVNMDDAKKALTVGVENNELQELSSYVKNNE